MNNKRTLIIAVVAVLVTLTSVSAFPALARLSNGASLMKSPGDEYIHPLFQEVKADGLGLMKSPGDEFIPAQEDRAISTQKFMARHRSK